MVHKPRNRAFRLAKVAGKVLVTLVWCGSAANLPAAPPDVHYEHAGIMPPGAIGRQQLQRGGPIAGFFQPVEIVAPEGAMISTAEQGAFTDPGPSPLKVGMLIGAVYRLRITNVPNSPGAEVFPSIEVIDRLYAPVGYEYRFPIPIELTQEELVLAIDGKFITRVIYLEEPDSAEPGQQTPGKQPYFEAPVGENPLDTADRLGRPVAILRLGGRVPGAEGPDERFLYGSPPLARCAPTAGRRGMPEMIDAPPMEMPSPEPQLELPRDTYHDPRVLPGLPYSKNFGPQSPIAPPPLVQLPSSRAVQKASATVAPPRTKQLRRD